MYDNSRQPSAVLPLVLGTVGAVLVGMVVQRVRGDRAAARGEVRTRGDRPARRPAVRKNRRGPVL
ncbi:hypothetical protein [Kocuria sabuli]|uniref:hypothetical protein n=1 Tax=Kocuria sabuli TaxID=3071448 RepID=UPI0034D6B709